MIDGAAAFAGSQQGMQHVDGQPQRADRVCIEHMAAATGLVQQRFQQVGEVGEVGDGGEAERRRAALDRMRGAEDDVDGFRVSAGAAVTERFQREQATFHRVQAFTALLEERGVEAGDVHSGPADA